MHNVVEWFTGLATLSGFAYFLLGFASAYVSHCVRQKLRHSEVRIPWHIAGIAIGTVAILIVTFQSSSAYSQAKETATEVQQCTKEFHMALIDRSQIAAENDEISQFQRRALYSWLHDIIFPPAPFDTMDTNDPRRQDWGLSRTIAVDRVLARSFDQQDALQKKRDAHPLPDPTCGR